MAHSFGRNVGRFFRARTEIRFASVGSVFDFHIPSNGPFLLVTIGPESLSIKPTRHAFSLPN
jgi:hypothetical protein